MKAETIAKALNGRKAGGDWMAHENLIAAAIDPAEDIRDPLDGLVEKTAADLGAPFTPEALERLAALKKEDRAAFEALRAQLKKSGCRVTALDDAIAEENGDAGGRGPTQADILIELARSAELFHTPDGTGFADLDINSHRDRFERDAIQLTFFVAKSDAYKVHVLKCMLRFESCSIQPVIKYLVIHILLSF